VENTLILWRTFFFPSFSVFDRRSPFGTAREISSTEKSDISTDDQRHINHLISLWRKRSFYASGILLRSHRSVCNLFFHCNENPKIEVERIIEAFLNSCFSTRSNTRILFRWTFDTLPRSKFPACILAISPLLALFVYFLPY